MSSFGVLFGGDFGFVVPVWGTSFVGFFLGFLWFLSVVIGASAVPLAACSLALTEVHPRSLESGDSPLSKR